MNFDSASALKSNAWPFKEAEALAKHLGNKLPEKGYVLFETGYGPSGLPHIGTFAEVFRTSLVRFAFEQLTGMPTKLFAFSDDLDGLRKVPDNIPNPEIIRPHLGKPLTQVPNPFGTSHESFAAHNNAKLREFLHTYGFDYEFKSATECYQAGLFDATLLAALKGYEAIQNIMLPTLGEERQQSYSPFMPICPDTGVVLQVPTLRTDAAKGTITYAHPTRGEVETTVTGGACKLQWKPDWAMRWAALGVDYEMHGKDLTPSVEVSTKLCRVMGGNPPLTFVYELFLDELGQKISKSKGNGLSMEDWLKYGTPESLSNFLFANPRKARKLYWDEIPKAVDEYITHAEKAPTQAPEVLFGNPAWHIHKGNIPQLNMPVSFALLLNLAAASNAEDAATLWGFISRYAPSANPDNSPLLNTLVPYAIQYYHDFVKPQKQYRAPTDQERAALEEVTRVLPTLPDDGEAIQTELFEVGKRHNFENLREFFKAFYEVCLGQSQGPRMGSFVALYGRTETIGLIQRALSGELEKKVA